MSTAGPIRNGMECGVNYEATLPLTPAQSASMEARKEMEVEIEDLDDLNSYAEDLNDAANKQGTSLNPWFQRKMGEIYQNGKNKQVRKSGSKLNHQENSARKGNQPINPSQVNGVTANKSTRQPKVNLKNQFAILEEEDFILDLKETIQRAELVTGGKVQAFTS
ncbi:hypothetical protein R6Q57_020635 [Mikania cordata]